MADFPDSLTWLDFVLGVFSFVITVLNLLALYANMVATIQAAPRQMRDALGNLRQQICEEREALQHQTSHSRHRHRFGYSTAAEILPLAYSDQTLALHYMTLRDLWIQFKGLERPFLVASDMRAEAIHRGDLWCEDDFDDEKVRYDIERHGEAGSFADWKSLYRCDFVHRFIWWQSKEDVKKLADMVQKVMLRRMEREVTQTRLMIMQIRGNHPDECVDENGVRDKDETNEKIHQSKTAQSVTRAHNFELFIR
ncbi:uncharacterized protein BCR38DRAFT_479983 [Pseudomassariella vexata]|uniref:Uncharacterized protein n=1 Tax=Pseudomassariella vexata TaxID=1141098 RepID=A0A1Y2EIW3_9PEZI|nr:uncharacterized protein BCR38DRAFT_479983 [Pseudomassariella vexata]ORY71490.1 hypothetical protein BCR38DRAFT_479983 [Pseudomassariella vexata]